MTTSHTVLIRRITLAALALLVIVIIVTVPRLIATPDIPSDRGDPQFAFRETSFEALTGWPDADFFSALETFERSCAPILNADPYAPANRLEALGTGSRVDTIAGLNSDWQPVCELATTLIRTHRNDPAPSIVLRSEMAKSFFEENFTPVQILNQYPNDSISPQETRGLFTGYFEPIYDASRTRTQRFSAPLYSRPVDLVEVDLGAFRKELAGTRIAGRVTDGRLSPFETRSQINAKGPASSTILAWLDPDDAFFLQIQGSGTLQFTNNTIIRVGFAGQNGHPYTAIGKVLVERGIMTLEEVSLGSIRDWLRDAGSADAQSLREENASYVFFTRLDNLPEPDLGPLGSQGVQLTPIHSLAVDRRYHAMGTPFWLDMESPFRGRALPYRQLMIAQDTGGAIRGPVRGDVFWGRGEDAASVAGGMRSRGIMVALIPNRATARWNGEHRGR